MRRKKFAISLTVLLASCSSLNLGGDDTGVLSGVGRIPGYDFGTAITLPEGFEIELPEIANGLIGPKVTGNRLLMIGDSIMASTSSRYGNEMCDALVPLGWQVAIEAEASRFAEFGNQVLDQRLKAEAGWDAAVVFLGTNYEGNKDSFAKQMRKIVAKLAPRPVLLVTTSLFRNSQREVNAAITVIAGESESVSVLDWEIISKAKGVLNKDGVHLSPKGRSVFAVAVARALDIAPFREGECLESKFRDDSAAAKDVMPAPVDTVNEPAVSSTP